MAKLVLSSHCQRIINAGQADKGLDPRRLDDLRSLLQECNFPSDTERSRCFDQIGRILSLVQPIVSDEDGFAKLCSLARIHWIKVRCRPCLGSSGRRERRRL